MPTYIMCKAMIARAIQNKQCDEKFKEDMNLKLDMFSLKNRITIEQYEELVNLMN